jgi:hypothetical protein
VFVVVVLGYGSACCLLLQSSWNETATAWFRCWVWWQQTTSVPMTGKLQKYGRAEEENINVGICGAWPVGSTQMEQQMEKSPEFGQAKLPLLCRSIGSSH